MGMIRPEDPERRTETGGDTTGETGRRIRLEGKEAMAEEVEVGFPVEVEVEGFPVEVEEDFLVAVGDVADVVDVVWGLKTEADIRRKVKIGDVVAVASKTMPTGWNVSSARAPSQMFHRAPPLRTQEMRSS